MNRLAGAGLLGLFLVFTPVCAAEGKPIKPDLASINDAKTWKVINGEARLAVEDGKTVVRLAPKGGNLKGSNIGLALVEGTEFTTGTIEVDLKGNPRASFLGIAFSAGDGKSFEAVYFRPFNFRSDDAVRRAHAVQYIAWPEHSWEKLRVKTPGKYESAVKPIPDPAGWFHTRIEVAKTMVSVYVDDAKEPCLVVNRLDSSEHGKIGLWVDSQEGAFRELWIVPAK